MRGEDTTWLYMKWAAIGSPPHAWGRRLDSRSAFTSCRFTPTCVGKTGGVGGERGAEAVHPHMRGEDSLCYCDLEKRAGSPPHAWGRHRLPGRSQRRVRFTPTCVGKTRRDSLLPSVRTVHPHMRGEDASGMDLAKAATRFTPTCVGKTTHPGQ